MTKLINQAYTGERALFNTHNAEIINCKFYDGESPLKESSDLKLTRSEFSWKYPLWYCQNVNLKDCLFQSTARSGVWYTKNIIVENSMLFAPKIFRRCDGVTLKNVFMSNAQETFWNTKNIFLDNVNAKGDYFGLNSSNIEATNFTIDGNYVFDGASNVIVKKSKIISKDAFWNCENVTVIDSYIVGEYLCWNTKNIKFINCVIESEQGMCYVDNLVLEDCELLNTNLAFEYSSVNATIKNVIDGIKNPSSGSIKALGIKEIIIDENSRCPLDSTKMELDGQLVDNKEFITKE